MFQWYSIYAEISVGYPIPTPKISRSKLIFLIASFMARLKIIKSWAALLSKQDEGLLSSIKASWAAELGPIIWLSGSNGFEAWFPHVSPSEWLLDVLNGAMYTGCSTSPLLVAIQVCNGTISSNTCTQCESSLLQYSMLNITHPASTTHPVKRFYFYAKSRFIVD